MTERRRPLVTASGWVVVVMGVAGVVGGLVFGWTELLVAGLFAVVLALVAATFLVGRTTGTIEIEVRDRHVVAGDVATVAVRVANESSRRRRARLAELVVGDGVESVRLPPLAAGESRDILVSVPTVHRGIIPLGPVTVVRRDPLGLARRDSVRSAAAELYVHPATVALALSATGLLRDLEGIPTADLTDSDISFHALRAYMPGDDRRHIHWKSTAKTGAFLVRQFEQTRRSHLIVLQSLAEADYADAAEFELAVSVVASIGSRAIVDGSTVSVFAGEPARSSSRNAVGRRWRSLRAAPGAPAGGNGTRARPAARAAGAGAATAVAGAAPSGRLRVRSPRDLLDDLSGVQESPRAARVSAVARSVGESAPDASVVFIACGSTVTARDLRAAASHFPIGVEVVAVVALPEAEATLVRIDSLRISRIGYLDDLVRVLTRAAGV